jgi:hypothetical protein
LWRWIPGYGSVRPGIRPVALVRCAPIISLIYGYSMGGICANPGFA